MSASEAFTIKLNDEFSGGVKAAKKAWADLGLEEASFDKRLKSLNSTLLNKQFKALQQTAVVKKESVAVTKDETTAVAGYAGMVAGATNAALSFAAAIGSRVVTELGNLATATAKGAIDAADWGTRTRTLLTALAGGDAARAARQIEEIRDVAKSTGSTMTEATEAFLEFSKAGIPDGYARNLAKIRIDAAALGPEFASAVDSLKDMKGTAVPTVDQFKKLNQLTGGKFGEALGLDKATLNNAGKLQQELAKIQPESFAKVFAVIGKNAGKIANDTRPVWQQIQNDISNAFSEAFDGVDLGPLREALKPLLAQLGPALKALAPVLTALVAGATELAIRLGATDWQAAWRQGVALFEAYKPIISAIGVGLLAVAAVFAVVAIAAVAVGASVAAGLGVAINVLQTIASVTASTVTAATNAASAIIAGIVSGITSGTGAVASAMTSLANTALGAFKSTLGIASPSKVFAEMGGYVAEGASVGIERGAPDVQAAANELAPSPPAASAGGKSGGGVVINLSVNGAGDPLAVAVEVERALRRAMLEFAT